MIIPSIIEVRISLEYNAAEPSNLQPLTKPNKIASSSSLAHTRDNPCNDKEMQYCQITFSKHILWVVKSESLRSSGRLIHPRLIPKTCPFFGQIVLSLVGSLPESESEHRPSYLNLVSHRSLKTSFFKKPLTSEGSMPIFTVHTKRPVPFVCTGAIGGGLLGKVSDSPFSSL